MATFKSLKQALTRDSSTAKKPLSDIQYRAGFELLLRGPGWTVYQDFIITHLSRLLYTILHSRSHISVLEIGPGPQTVLGYLPDHLSRSIGRYAAFEPNQLFATSLEESLCSTSDVESTLPGLKSPPHIYRAPFDVNSSTGAEAGANKSDNAEKFDLILFCHSMYGMKPRRGLIERALDMLAERPEGAMVVTFHRYGVLDFDGLVSYQTALFPVGTVSIPDNDDVLDRFAPFIAGFVPPNEAVQAEWRKLCRSLGSREESSPNHLLFSSPEIMVAFTKHATTLPELTAQVSALEENRLVKNQEAQLHRPATIVKPTEVKHVQQCVRWAVNHGVGLSILGGGHSGHCIWPHVVSVDMGAFDKVHILQGTNDEKTSGLGSGSFVVAGAGCKTGDIISKALAAGLTVPLGARPSVGAGLCLQGGIGHLARLHGLTCDAIAGAVIVSVDSGQLLYVGHVPSQHRPADAVRPENDAELLWAIKGSGTNFGVVVSITFHAYPAPTYSVRNWIIPMSDDLEACRKLSDFNELVAKKLPRRCSTDAYLYWEAEQLHLGVTMFELSTAGETHTLTPVDSLLGPARSLRIVDCIDVFDCEMYMSEMHGGHGGGKTSAFKRCLFLKDIGRVDVAKILIKAVRTRPSPFCYLHLLHGGGAISDVAADATAFGCRDWDFACVITGIWSSNEDETEVARKIIQWVYSIVEDLMPLSTGSYSTDLGPDPRDIALVAKAFGPNLSRLARLKRSMDPSNVLAYACPLQKMPMEPRLIILVSGEIGVGKDYCACVWASMFNANTHKDFTVRVVSISDAMKREYAAESGADLNRLLRDRVYKEQHRSALTAFYQERVRKRHRLPEERFLSIVKSSLDVDVLIITGVRDEAPVATLSHLVSDSRLLDVHVTASEETRLLRRRFQGAEDNKGSSCNGEPNETALNYRPSLVLDNSMTGSEAAENFAKRYLFPFVHEDLSRLASMVPSVPDFPRPGIDFRHVLNISQQPGGLSLCTSLLKTHFTGDWAKISAVMSCEAGGFIFGSALADRVNLPMVPIRDAGKLPPPVVSVSKVLSHISASPSADPRKQKVEMYRDAVPKGASVVVVDDVLARGTTLCGVLRLLETAGIDAELIHVMVVAEFPIHGGRELLRQSGFGKVSIQSLLVFDGA
ncbi:hypothetical protein GGS21DRAFT_511946 [Xylaria nigripes]|nr:hypothetical protein GGS21DRAFT_511946 [Xylaria nigripes]